VGHTKGEFLVSDEALPHEVFDMVMPGVSNATWPAQTEVLQLLPDTGHGDEEDVGKKLHQLTRECWMGQVGCSVLFCALVAIEWDEELPWWAAGLPTLGVSNLTQLHPGVWRIVKPSLKGGWLARRMEYYLAVMNCTRSVMY
jgi:hypothetical protein